MNSERKKRVRHNLENLNSKIHSPQQSLSACMNFANCCNKEKLLRRLSLDFFRFVLGLKSFNWSELLLHALSYKTCFQGDACCKWLKHVLHNDNENEVHLNVANYVSNLSSNLIIDSD